MSKNGNRIGLFDFSHDELTTIASKLLEAMGYTVYFGRYGCPVNVDLVGVKGRSKIAVECGNLSGEDKEKRVAQILSAGYKYLHLPYILSYVPTKELIEKSISEVTAEIRGLTVLKWELSKTIEKLKSELETLEDVTKAQKLAIEVLEYAKGFYTHTTQTPPKVLQDKQNGEL